MMMVVAWCISIMFVVVSMIVIMFANFLMGIVQLQGKIGSTHCKTHPSEEQNQYAQCTNHGANLPQALTVSRAKLGRGVGVDDTHTPETTFRT